MRLTSKPLLVIALVVGALAAGLGFWVRHRPVSAHLRLAGERGHIDVAKMALYTSGAGPGVAIFADEVQMHAGNHPKGYASGLSLHEGVGLSLYRTDLGGVTAGDWRSMVSIWHKTSRATFECSGIQIDSSNGNTRWGSLLEPSALDLGDGRLAGNQLRIGADRNVRIDAHELRTSCEWSPLVRWPRDLFNQLE